MLTCIIFIERQILVPIFLQINFKWSEIRKTQETADRRRRFWISFHSINKCGLGPKKQKVT